MNTQEDLDQLIEQRLSGEQQVSPIDEESAFLLVAAKMLVQLQEIALHSNVHAARDRLSSRSYPRSKQTPFQAVPGERHARSIRVTTEGEQALSL